MPIQDGKEIGLFKYSEGYRNRETVRNKHKANNEYRASHPDALSDGDELGKGENNGQVGGKTDILQRKNMETKNRYTKNNPYSLSKT